VSGENDLGVGSSADRLEESVEFDCSFWDCPLDVEVAS
jgi:hypothetical protein